ncbi:MAG: hypothetical protein ACR2QB_08645 [Gammaproteobacteria bacterium]
MRRLLIILLLLSPLTATAQMNDPAYADYFLVGRFGEVCTMCEVVVMCEAAAAETQRDSLPRDGSFTVYHIQTRTFWSQIGTIWEWFVRNFDDRTVDGHERPVLVYTIDDGSWSAAEIQTARFTLATPLIAAPGWSIDRQSRRWQQEPGARAVGYCYRLPLWESLAAIEQQAPSGEAL